MSLISGLIQRKAALSLVEKVGVKDENEPISFAFSAVDNLGSLEGDEVVVQLKNPPFKNVDHFHILCKSKDILNNPDFRNETALKILEEIRDGSYKPIFKGMPKEEYHTMKWMIANELIYEAVSNQYDITKKGHQVLDHGGLKEAEKTPNPAVDSEEISLEDILDHIDMRFNQLMVSQTLGDKELADLITEAMEKFPKQKKASIIRVLGMKISEVFATQSIKKVAIDPTIEYLVSAISEGQLKLPH